MIDVLLSVLNGEKYIERSIKSVLGQSISDFVFYIVDDASADNTSKIIKRFHDSRIIFFQNESSMGLTRNLNWLLTKCRNKYIARLDADDISRVDRFEKQIIFLERGKLDLVGSNCRVINMENETIGERTYLGGYIKNDLIKFNMFPHSSWFGKREVFEKLHGYDENFKYAQDYDFLLRAFKNFKLGVAPEDLIDLRWDNRSLSLSHLKEQQKFALKARLNAISRGDYSKANYIYLLIPLISYIIPANINKTIYKWILN